MNLLVITDIFGKEYLSKTIYEGFENLIVLDPYENKKAFFEDEKEAYEFYIKNYGHDKYFDLAYEICKNHKIDAILGFSAGASVAFRLACRDIKTLKKVVSFYPSQIRNYLNLEAKVKTSIVFARREDSFNTEKISQELSKNRNISIQISDYEHGFMNKKSKNYNKKAYKKYLEYIRKEIYETKN